MAKYTSSFTAKGELYVADDGSEITITTTTKDEVLVYDLLTQLKLFNGATVTFSIKQDQEVLPIGE